MAGADRLGKDGEGLAGDASPSFRFTGNPQ